MGIFSFLTRLLRGQHRLSAAEFKARREVGDPVLDVRSPGEYAQGHVAGAVNVDVNGADFASRVERLVREGTLDTSAPVFVYCRSGARSGRATRILRDRGFEHAFNVGGIRGLDTAGVELRR